LERRILFLHRLLPWRNWRGIRVFWGGGKGGGEGLCVLWLVSNAGSDAKLPQKVRNAETASWMLENLFML
jgi:hypothetical protein